MPTILECRGLRKHYGDVHAVDGLDLVVQEGSCLGILGPNGAGKTTTIEMLEGITPPTEGNILFRGRPLDRAFKEKVGIQFQSTALPEFITVKETLRLFSSFYREARDFDEVVRLCSLDDILERDNRKLSGGQRQRMLLALAIVSKPDILFLDEPTTGLDPQARRNFWELIRGIRKENVTVLLTTHYMDEASELCDEIAIMDRGKILERDKPARLLAHHFSGALVRVPSACVDGDRAPGGGSHQGDSYEIQSENLDQTMRELLAEGINLEGLSIHKPDLEDLFIKLTGSSLRA
jgi:ABC-2 type transport system ATP-binding protein